VNTVTLHTKEYEAILKRLDKVSDLQKQLLFALKARDPRPHPATNAPKGQPFRTIARELVGGLPYLFHSGPEWQ